MRVPSPVAVRLGVMAFAVAGKAAIFLTFTDPFFSLLCSSPYRSAVTGKGQMLWINQAFTDGKIQELLFIETKDKKKRIYRFYLPALQQGQELRSYAGGIARSFISFLFPFRRFHFREAVFWGKVVGVILPDPGEKIIKRADTRSISKRETTKDSIKRSFPEHTAPYCNGSYFQFQSKQVGTQHTGWEPWFQSENRVAFLH